MHENRAEAGETMVSGTVFDIQKYSLHDGPGIRTVVFFKGCPLHCKWCSNPESLNRQPQLYFIRSKCIRCGCCVCAAPKGVVSAGADGRPEIDFAAANKKTLDWTSCCPTGALLMKGETMTADEVFETVMQDELFYRQSGGGMTLSGGEPLLQPEFALELLKKARGAAISTAMETTGAVSEQSLLLVKPYVDLFLYDFKHLLEKEHLAYTGVSTRPIRQNLELLARLGTNIMVRMPVIPGVNDELETVQETLRYLRRIGIKKFAFLPFHQYGSGKYSAIGMPYEMQELTPPDEKKMRQLFAMAEREGFSDNMAKRSAQNGTG